MNRFQTLFQRKQKTFIPFLMLGYPTPEISLALIKAAIEAGADALELGVPFSDPGADGPVIQAAAQQALSQGTDTNTCIRLIQQIRAFSEIPIGIMLYYNLIHKRGMGAMHQTFANAGVDAMLAVDLPMDASHAHEVSLHQHQLGCIHLIAPNTPLSRANQLIERSTAFTYVVSDYGTTGTRDALPPQTYQRLSTLRNVSDKPLVVGFGIHRASQMSALYEAGANGIIVGSAFTKLIAEHHAKPTLFQLIKENIAQYTQNIGAQ